MKNIVSIVIALLILLSLSACVDAFSKSSSLENEAVIANKYDILVATSRKKEKDGSFGADRSLTLSYAQYQISVPKLVRPGKFIYPQTSNDPKRAYKILASESIASAEGFNRAVINNAFNIRNTKEVVIFVHGFNSNFEKTIFRAAKIDADFNTPATTILYSWPSAIELSLYLHDMDSAAFARDGLEKLLSDLANSKINKITLVGHSMGASIIMETLRQISFKGNKKILNKIGGIAMLSADMAVDLFAEQANDIKNLPQPFVIYSSKQDWVLQRFADIFHDGKQRLGNITNFLPLAGLDIIVIDSSNIHDTSDSYHMAAAAAPTMISLINSIPKVGFDSFGAYAKNGKVDGAKITTDGSLYIIELGAL